MEKVFAGNPYIWPKNGPAQELGKGRGLTLYRQNFTKPNNTQDDFDFVSGKTGVTVLSIAQDGRLILKSEFKQGTNGLSLEFASAVFNAKDDMVTVARDKLRAETGHKADKLILLPEDVVFGPRKFDFGYRLMVATGCEWEGPPRPDANEGGFNVFLATADEFWDAVNTKEVIACQTVHAAHAMASIGLITPNPKLKALFSM